jgi:hypothetical protein
VEMADFSSGLSGSKLDSSQREQLMEQVKAQIAIANAQELLQVCKCMRLSHAWSHRDYNAAAVP